MDVPVDGTLYKFCFAKKKSIFTDGKKKYEYTLQLLLNSHILNCYEK